MMHPDTEYRFIPGGPPNRKQSRESAPFFIILQGEKILIRKNNSPFISIKSFNQNNKTEIPIFIGDINTTACYTVEQKFTGNSQLSDIFGLEETDGYSWQNLRGFLPVFNEAEVRAVSRARHLLTWNSEVLFCSRCGGPLGFHSRDTAKICQCGFVDYPRISPAVIISITREDKILLAHNIKFQGNIHSLIAGFVDPGENLEEAVIREIREEVGLEVEELTYISSQPWPFPNSLMCAFTARWKSGEILVDGIEIDKAAWFSRENLPPVPRRGSVSRTLIDLYIHNKE